MDSLESVHPLYSITYVELQKLTQTLWNWQICRACQNGNICADLNCSWRRSTHFTHFFDFYKNVTSSYVPDLLPDNTPALQKHDDVLEIIRFLRSQPNVKRSELTHAYFSESSKQPPCSDQHRAFNLAIRIMSMVKCSVDDQPSGLLELGTQPVQWHSDESLAEFLSRAFPRIEGGNLYVHDGSGKIRDVKSLISAGRLTKVGRLRFQGTNDLRSHLKLDAKKGVVEIYHYVSVLREHLAASQELSNPSVSRDAVLIENIPCQIALKTLDSLRILFPFGNDSEKIAQKLISKQSMDLTCLYDDSAPDYDQSDGETKYNFFNGRLMDLYKEPEDPGPRGALGSWFQRKSGARYVMMATLIGVAIAVMLDILGLAVAIFQAWVAYEAWKHPVETLH